MFLAMGLALTQAVHAMAMQAVPAEDSGTYDWTIHQRDDGCTMRVGRDTDAGQHQVFAIYQNLDGEMHFLLSDSSWNFKLGPRHDFRLALGSAVESPYWNDIAGHVLAGDDGMRVISLSFAKRNTKPFRSLLARYQNVRLSIDGSEIMDLDLDIDDVTFKRFDDCLKRIR